MKKLNPVELSRQLREPSGAIGLEVAKILNAGNQTLYDMAFSLFEFKPGECILEIGFGNGAHFDRYFEQEPNLKVTGVDISADMVSEAKRLNRSLHEKGQLELHHSSTTSIPAADEAFDWVVALNVVYFWDPPAPALQEIYRVLKPGGRLLLGYRPKEMVKDLPFTRQNFILYDPEELQSLLARHHFIDFAEKQNTYEKKAHDGTDIKIADFCLVGKKATFKN